MKDYIYKNKKGEKKVGEISYLHITPFYEFEVKMNNRKITCYLDHLLLGWKLSIVEIDEIIELAHPTDIRWNNEAIFEKIRDEDKSLQIAYAIKEVYEEKNYSEDVL